MEGSEPPSGFLAGFRRIAETVLSTLQNRVELIAVELQEEKVWFLNTLLRAAATIFFSVFAVMLLTVMIVLLFPEAARPYVLAVFCLMFGSLAVSMWLGLRKWVTERPPPLDDTVSELKKDIAWLKSQEPK